MKHEIRGMAALLLIANFAGCGEPAQQLPVLTKDAFLEAAKRCGAQEPEFSFPIGGKLPSFSYLDPGPLNSGHATPTSQCLAASLKGYRYQSMSIRTKPERAAGD